MDILQVKKFMDSAFDAFASGMLSERELLDRWVVISISALGNLCKEYEDLAKTRH